MQVLPSFRHLQRHQLPCILHSINKHKASLVHAPPDALCPFFVDCLQSEHIASVVRSVRLSDAHRATNTTRHFVSLHTIIKRIINKRGSICKKALCSAVDCARPQSLTRLTSSTTIATTITAKTAIATSAQRAVFRRPYPPNRDTRDRSHPLF